MKTDLGGDRLGSGGKQEIVDKNFSRSTHDLSANWRSSMSSGTLVPFMNQVGLPGDKFEIDLNCEVVTLPTIGPLFGSYKVQLDVFQVPIRLYNVGLQLNKLNIGNDMSKVHLPQVRIPFAPTQEDSTENKFGANAQINSSSIFKYLGISGMGRGTELKGNNYRDFNAVPWLAYWDIFKNYYSNKQEDNAYVVHTGTGNSNQIFSATLYEGGSELGSVFPNSYTHTQSVQLIVSVFCTTTVQPDVSLMTISRNGVIVPVTEVFANSSWQATAQILTLFDFIDDGDEIVTLFMNNPYLPVFVNINGTVGPWDLRLDGFPLSNIDKMRERIIQQPFNQPFIIENVSGAFDDFFPYVLPLTEYTYLAGETIEYSVTKTQEGLAVKTYQSDLFNNWINTEWIDGENGVNEITAVSVEGGSFTIDALNLSTKVYKMLNRIAVSGGSYDDWLDAAYAHDRHKGITSPVYHGSLIKELSFEEVISNSLGGDGTDTQPLGTLAGRGRMTNKSKGGKMTISVDEPSYIMGIVSLTPRINYSQGNTWDVNLKTMNDFHKPDLDAIGFQDLITEQMVWSESTIDFDGNVSMFSAGKQPAWINYMTNIDKTYGNFAEANKDMFMTLNRMYDVDPDTGKILDLTTYIDPTKFNNIFAQSDLSAQNFWVQIRKNIKVRRKISAKVIPNL